MQECNRTDSDFYVTHKLAYAKKFSRSGLVHERKTFKTEDGTAGEVIWK